MASTSKGGTGCRETHLRDQDLVRWLENKLGSSELWGGRHASSMLTREMLVELETCFQELEPATKMKIIQAMAHLSPKTVQAWKVPLLNLIELARRDPDDWVEAMADLFRNFPDLGFIQSSSRPDSYFNKTLDQLMQILIKTFDNDANDVQFPLPPDSELMNASAIQATFGPESLAINRQRHFMLKKQANKFDKLLADVKKASEQQNNPANRKTHGMLASSFPIKMRSSGKKMGNDLPMKGLSSSTNALKMSTGFSNDAKKFQQRTLLKRVGGAQLLDIAELPQQNKRRRTTVNAQPTATGGGGDQPTTKQQRVRQNSMSATTNKKGGNLSSSNDNKLAGVEVEMEEEEVKTADTTNDASSLPLLSVGPSSSAFLAAAAACSMTMPSNNNASGGDGGEDGAAPLPLPAVVRPSPGRICLLNKSMVGSHPQQQPLLSSSVSSASSTTSCFNNLFAEISNDQQQQAAYGDITMVENEAMKQFNGLLKDANKLSPLSYNMIVSFLSGNKTNPLMDKLGTLITLPLSETIEFESGFDGATTTASVFLVETFFQMNYSTGEWKRLRKSRLLKPEELGKYSHYLGPKLSSMAMDCSTTTASNTTMGSSVMMPLVPMPSSSSMPSLVPYFAADEQRQSSSSSTSS